MTSSYTVYFYVFVINKTVETKLWHSMVQKYHSSNALECRLKSQIMYLQFLIITYDFQYVFNRPDNTIYSLIQIILTK